MYASVTQLVDKDTSTGAEPLFPTEILSLLTSDRESEQNMQVTHTKLHAFERAFDSTAYFKITKLQNGNATDNCDFMWICTEHTTLVQDGTVQSPVPTHLRSYLADVPLYPHRYLTEPISFY